MAKKIVTTKENIMKMPKITKIMVNSGIGGFKDSRDLVESFTLELASLTGQKPSYRKAKASEAGFKIRQGEVVGLAVTLRGKNMLTFFDKLINVVFPRMRGFWGMDPKSFDGSGNYSFGIREHTVFPEINANVTKAIRSLQVTVCTSATDDESALNLLKMLKFPFKKE